MNFAMLKWAFCFVVILSFQHQVFAAGGTYMHGGPPHSEREIRVQQQIEKEYEEDRHRARTTYLELRDRQNREEEDRIRSSSGKFVCVKRIETEIQKFLNDFCNPTQGFSVIRPQRFDIYNENTQICCIAK